MGETRLRGRCGFFSDGGMGWAFPFRKSSFFWPFFRVWYAPPELVGWLVWRKGPLYRVSRRFSWSLEEKADGSGVLRGEPIVDAVGEDGLGVPNSEKRPEDGRLRPGVRGFGARGFADSERARELEFCAYWMNIASPKESMR